MKKYTVICRILISFGCIVFLLTSCDDPAKELAKPTVVRKKISAQGPPKTAVTTQRPNPARPVKAVDRPAAPAIKPVKTETPPPAKPPALAVSPAKPAVPQPKSDISPLTTRPAVAAAKQASGSAVTGGALMASGAGARPFYNPAGKIDPFEPLFKDKPSPQKVKKSVRKRREPRTPLERIDLSQLKLVGIILASSGNRALVEEASGKGYVIKKGTYIGTNAGKVTAIRQDMVIVEEEYEDVYGKQKMKKRELKLPKPPGEL